jgi:hypothetical protein
MTGFAKRRYGAEKPSIKSQRAQAMMLLTSAVNIDKWTPEMLARTYNLKVREADDMLRNERDRRSAR